MTENQDSRNYERDNEETELQKWTRRGFLGTAALTGVSGMAAGQSNSPEDSSAVYNWKRDTDANGYNLTNLRALGMKNASAPIQDFAGEDLYVDNSGLLNSKLGLRSALNNGRIVPIAAGVSRDPIDPNAHERPVQTALNAVTESGNGGAVYLPDQEISERTTIDMSKDVSLVGLGMKGSKIRIQETGVPGIDLTKADFSYLDRFSLLAPAEADEGASTGPAITIGPPEPHEDLPDSFNQYKDDCNDVMIDHITIEGWNDAALRANSILWSSRINHIRANSVDAGDSRAMFEFNTVGFFSVGQLHCYPSAEMSGKNSNIVFMGEVSGVLIELLNIGGSAGHAIWHKNIHYDASGPFMLQAMNYEPAAHESTPSSVVRLEHNPGVEDTTRARRSNYIGHWKSGRGSQTIAEYGYEIVGQTRDILTYPAQNGPSTFGKNIVNVVEEHGCAPSWYWGLASEVDNNSDDETNLRVLETAGTSIK